MTAKGVLKDGPRDGLEVEVMDDVWAMPGGVTQSVCIEIVEPTPALLRDGFACWRLLCTFEGVPMRDERGRLLYRLDTSGVSWVDT